MCDFDNFPDDETPSRHKEARSHVDRTSRAKLWLARMKRGYTYLIVVDATLAIIVMKKHSQKYQYDTIRVHKVLAVCQAPSQNKGFARNSYRRYSSLYTILRVS